METLVTSITTITAAASWVLTRIVRWYAIRRGIFDVPNTRSSHLVATPRGGGLAIAVTFLIFVALLASYGRISGNLAAATIGGGVVVAGIGWVDDRHGLPAASRAVAQGLATLWALYWLGGLPSLNLGVTRLSLGSVGFVLGVVGIVWFVNLYNFMDGIDGLAGTEAITVAGTAALLIGGTRVGLLPNPGMTETAPGVASIALLSLLLVPASAGFLVWNWPPARIFMSNVGSGFLGFTFGVLAVASENFGALPLQVWVLLLGVFVVDATATLLRRIWHRERWTEAHRTHAYQLAVQAGHTHKQVTVAVLGINIALAAAATAACVWPRSLLAVAGICGIALVVLYMASGLPVVASPVGVNKDIVKDGVNGFLASKQKEWEDRLDQLERDVALRIRLGWEGRRLVERFYSLQVVSTDCENVTPLVPKWD